MKNKPTPKPTPTRKPVPTPPKPAPTPPPPPAPPVVWQRLDLLGLTTRVDINQLASHAGAVVIEFAGATKLRELTYGLGYVNIIPSVGTLKEQTSDDNGASYHPTGVTIIQSQAGANPTTSINLTLDGGVGPAKFMRYLKA